MAKATRSIPEGYHTVTPHLTVRGAARAIDFYARAFGAEEVTRMPAPDGGRSPEALGGTPASLHLYVEDVDQAFARAVAAGAKVRMPVRAATAFGGGS